MVVEEYEPEFGMEDVPQLSEFDFASVEGFLRASGMLGMWFEDRGGGFGAMRERMGVGNEEGMVEDNGEEKKNDAPAVEVDNNYSTYIQRQPIQRPPVQRPSTVRYRFDSIES